MVQPAPKGAPAKSVVAQVTRVAATVEAINCKQRWVHLRGPWSKLINVSVPGKFVHFPNVRVGNQVIVRRTEAIAMKLQKR
jgi:hypothetical protein